MYQQPTQSSILLSQTLHIITFVPISRFVIDVPFSRVPPSTPVLHYVLRRMIGYTQRPTTSPLVSPCDTWHSIALTNILACVCSIVF